jgi:hypothetical protein
MMVDARGSAPEVIDMFRRRRLACSFCRRGEAEVARLVAGPNVYICDECVTLAQRAMEGRPADEGGPREPRPGVLQRLWGRLFRRCRRGPGRPREPKGVRIELLPEVG